MTANAGLSESTPPIYREANYELTSRTAAVTANSASIHKMPQIFIRRHLVYIACVSCLVLASFHLSYDCTLFCFYFPTTNKPMDRTRKLMKRGPKPFSIVVIGPSLPRDCYLPCLYLKLRDKIGRQTLQLSQQTRGAWYGANSNDNIKSVVVFIYSSSLVSEI